MSAPWPVRARGRWWMVASALCAAGCADFDHPDIGRLLRHPWTSREPVYLGENQHAALKRWGEPDERRVLGRDRLGTQTEEWVYRAAFHAIPVDYMYVSHTQHLIFDGDNLVRWFEEP